MHGNCAVDANLYGARMDVERAGSADEAEAEAEAPPSPRGAGIFALDAVIDDESGDDFSAFDASFANPLANKQLLVDDDDAGHRGGASGTDLQQLQFEYDADTDAWIDPTADGTLEMLPRPGGMCSPTNPVQRFCSQIATHPATDFTIVAVTFVNTVMLALHPPGKQPAPEFARVLHFGELVATVIFIMEALVLWVHMGLFGGGGYFRSSGKWFDFIIVVAAVAGFFVTRSSATNAMRSLRMLRLVREFRRFEKMQALITAVSEAIGLFRDVIGLLFFSLLTWCTIGMHLYKGLLSHRCQTHADVADVNGAAGLPCPIMLHCEPADSESADLSGLTGECVARSRYNGINDGTKFYVGDKEFFGFHGFDNLTQAFVTVFVQMTCDGGMQDVPHLIRASDHVSSQAKSTVWGFFGLVVLVCSWVVLSLFTAVLSSVFGTAHHINDEDPGHMSMDLEPVPTETREQDRETFEVEPTSPRVTLSSSEELSFQQRCEALADNSKFEWFITACIVISVSLIVAVGDSTPDHIVKIVDTLDSFFLAVFVFEAFVKICGYGWQSYWSETSNKADFCIVGFTLLSMIVSAIIQSSVSGQQSLLALRLPRLLRLLRLTNLTRVLYKFDNIKMIFTTVFESGGMIVALCGFIVFAQCVFAIFGMQMLGGSMPDGNIDGTCWGGPQWGGIPGANCGAKNDYTRRNFETFSRAFMTCFQYMTGEAWSQIMFFYAAHSAWGQYAVYTFFMLLFLWQNCITVSLFVAIILDNFSLTDEEKVRRQRELYENELKRKLGTSDPYVELRFTPEGDGKVKQQRQKTPVIKRDLNPVWTHGNVFNFRMASETAKLKLTVFDWDLASADDFMGEVRILVSSVNDGESMSLEYQYELPPGLDGAVQMQTVRLTLVRSEAQSLDLKLQDSADNLEKLDIAGHLFVSCCFDVVNGDTVLQVIIERGENLCEADDNGMEALGVVALAFPELFDATKQGQTQGFVYKLQPKTAASDGHVTLCCLTLENKFRKACIAVVPHPAFTGFIIFMIMLSCAVLAIEGPPKKFERESQWQDEVKLFNGVATIVFMLEAFMKITAYGFIHRAHPSEPSYLSQPLNCIDFFVVVLIGVSYLLTGIGIGDSDGGVIRALRILRVLQPLRFMLRSERMQTILQAFVVALPGAGAVFVLVVLFLLVFAIVSVELFSGRLMRCCDCADVLTPIYYALNGTMIENKDECLAQNLLDEMEANVTKYCWDNPAYNFDNTGAAFQSLFKVTTTHGWVDIMEAVVDSREGDLQPMRDSFWQAEIFFIGFHVIVTFFMLNIFIGVMASSFSEASRTNLYTTAEKRWVRVLHMLDDFSPKEGGAQRVWTEDDAFWEIRRGAKDLIDLPLFERIITVVVGINVLVLLADHYPESAEWAMFVAVINTICLLIFTAEMLIKIVGWGPVRYLSDGMAQLDIIVVFGSWCSLAFSVRSGLEVLRVFRTARILLILAHFDGLMALYSTIVRCVPAAFNVMMVSLILFFIYAVVGMSLFGDIEHKNCSFTCPGRHNDADNFSNFWHAMMLLFQWATGQCEYNLMHDLANDTEWGPGLVFAYFATFKFASDYVCINLIVGIILDTFDNTYSTEKMPFTIDDLWWFREEWAKLVIAAVKEAGASRGDESPAQTEQLLNRIQKDPTKVSLSFDRMRALLFDMSQRHVLNFENLEDVDRSYLLIQCELHATRIEVSRKLPGFKALPVGRGKPKLSELLPSALDFDQTLQRLILFSLGRESMMYADMMDELTQEKEYVARQIVNVAIRAWLAQVTVKICPSKLPEQWRGKPSLYKQAVVAVRNVRLGILLKLGKTLRHAKDAAHSKHGSGDSPTLNAVNGNSRSSSADADEV